MQTKFEECECKLLNLKEAVVKADLYEKKLKESQCKLKTMECKLQETEQQNETLIVSFFFFELVTWFHKVSFHFLFRTRSSNSTMT